MSKPSEEATAENSERTRLALDAMLQAKAAQVHGVLEKAVADKKDPTYIRYTPSSQGAAQASGATNRVIRMVEAPVDPMEPPNFKHKRVPRGPPSPPAPVMHSPPRKITVQDQQDWKIPPCISNWKNIKGYTIPLDKRLAADGRGMQEVQISDNFASLSEALYVAERSAREEVEKRATIQKRIATKDKESKEHELRSLAHAAREERAHAPPATMMAEGEPGVDWAERDELRGERKRERERERRMESKDGKRSQMTRGAERDISEQFALGQAAPNSTETLYDQRLFNQSEGVASGFTGEDDAYNVYDKALFKGGAAADAIFRPTKSADEDWGEEDAAAANVLKDARFKPGDKAFDGTGTEPGGRAESCRGRPVEFEADSTADPFGLDDFLCEAKNGNLLDTFGESSGIGATASGSQDGRGSSLSSMQFRQGKGGN